MIEDHHYRLFDVRRRGVVVQVYVRENEDVMSVLIKSTLRFGVPIRGRYRVERMVWERGRIRWDPGPVFLVSPK